jgi:hypothetical protein
MTPSNPALRRVLLASAGLCLAPSVAAAEDGALAPPTVSPVIVQGHAQARDDQPLSGAPRFNELRSLRAEHRRCALAWRRSRRGGSRRAGRGLDLSASATWVDSRIVRDPVFPAAVGKRTPQVPRLRWTAVATWRANERLTLTTAARYSDRVFGTIDNTDLIGHTYQGFEGYLVVDACATYRIDGHWSAAIGVDNLTNSNYFVFHPFPQRSALAELRYVY